MLAEGKIFFKKIEMVYAKENQWNLTEIKQNLRPKETEEDRLFLQWFSWLKNTIAIGWRGAASNYKFDYDVIECL